MKLLDRYLFSIFGTAFALVTLTFLALFTAMDLSSRIARILSLKNINTVPFLAHYYLVRLPMFLHLILPAVSLFSAMFTVIQLQKTNELLPMITSGVSLRRLSLIFIVGALVCSGVMAVLDEFVLPELMDDIGETDDILISDKPQRNLIYAGKKNLVLVIDEYDRVKKQMRGLTLTRYRDGGRREEVIRAATGDWDSRAKQWILKNGEVTPFDAGGNPQFPPGGDGRRIFVVPIPPEGVVLPEPPHPDDFKRTFSISGRSFRYSELKALIGLYPHIEAFHMHMNLKFASPLGPLVLLFLGLPFVSGTQHRSFYRGIALCLLLTIAYYAATFVCFELGIRGGGLSPAVAVWGPLGVFGLAGLVSFLRMRS
jgi:lipopolysaccharide export LptBFGC system permease protein LptF